VGVAGADSDLVAEGHGQTDGSGWSAERITDDW
jgi:hypothetical protein